MMNWQPAGLLLLWDGMHVYSMFLYVCVCVLGWVGDINCVTEDKII